MTGFVFDVVSEIFLFGVVPLFLTVGTVAILWHVLEKINPDEVTDIESFSTFIVVVVHCNAHLRRTGNRALR
jgi:hypothetical protein